MSIVLAGASASTQFISSHVGVGGHGVSSLGVAHAVRNVAPIVAHHAPVVAYQPQPYTYSYAVADDYTGTNFQAGESSDGAGNKEGSYSVALPDGRIQHVNYYTNDYDGYVADVTYDGQAVVSRAAPVVAHAVHTAPVVGHAVPAVGRHSSVVAAHPGLAHFG